MGNQPAKHLPVRKQDGERRYSYGYGYGYYGYGQGYRKEKRPRKLNVGVLLGSFVLFAAVSTAVYFWHDHQLQRLSVALLEHAEQKESENEWRDASDAFYRYWKITKDPKVLGRLAPAYDKASVAFDRPGVISSYQRAIGRLPDRVDLRTRLMELLYRDGQFGLALEQANKTLELDGENVAAAKFRALSETALFRKGEALDANHVVDQLEKTFQQQPTDFELARELTRLIRVHLQAGDGTDLATRADDAMDLLVNTTRNNPYTYVARHNYRSNFDLPGAKQDIDTALMLAPENPIVIRQAAWDAHQDTDYLTARQLFKQLVKLTPDQVNGYVGLGDAEFFSGSPRDAVRTWQMARQRGLTTLPLLIRLVDAQLQLSQLEQAESTLADADVLSDALRKRGAERERNWATASTAYFRGQLELARGDIYAALPKLQIAATLGRDLTPHTRRGANTIGYSALISLGKTFTELGRWEDAAVAFDRALDLKPRDSEPLLAAAKAWAALGQPMRSIELTRLALQQSNTKKHAVVDLAQYLLEHQLALPKAERDWHDFEVALADARKRLANSWQLRALEVDYAMRQSSDPSRALALLLSIEQDFPNNVEVWKRLPLVYETMGQTAQTDRTLKRLESLTSSSPETKVLVADILLHRGQVESATLALQGMEPDQLLQVEQWKFDLAKLRIAEASGDAERIDQHLISLVKKYPTEVWPLQRLLDRRLAGTSPSSQPTTPELLQSLQQMRDATATGWQYYAARADMQAGDSSLVNVTTYLSELRNARPYWSRTHELVGRVALGTGSLRGIDVREAFEASVACREPNPEMFTELMKVYLAEHDYLAIWHLLDQWHQPMPILRMLENGHWAEAQKRLNVGNFQPTDLSPEVALVWQHIGAESFADSDAFLVEHPESLVGWMLLLMEGIQQNDLKTEQRAREQIGALQLPPGVKAYALAQGLQFEGKFQKAIDSYNTIAEESDYRLRSEIYAGFASSQIESLRVPLQLAGPVAPPRVANRRSELRLEAIMKLRRGGRTDLAEAKQLLEDLTSQAPADANDRILLAKCLESLGDTEQADQQLTSLVEAEPTAQHLATLAEFLLRQGNTDRAGVWIDQLEDQSGPTNHTISLRARWLAAQHRHAEIPEIVEAFAKRQIVDLPEDAVPTHMLEIAKIYRDAGMPKASQRWLSLLTDRFPGYATPLDFLLLEDDVTEASIQRCLDQLEARPSMETSLLLARILVYGNVSEATLRRVKPVLEQTRERYPKNGSLLFALGNLKLKAGLIDEAIELLTEVTEVQPSHYLAWNNLAALLAEQDGREDEAMRNIDKAIEYAAYDVPTLLDTKAVVLMHAGRFDDAAQLLQAEVTNSDSATDPRFFFHLALVLDKTSDASGAKQALREADDLGLDGAFLTQAEQQQLSTLRDKFTIE